MTLYDKIIQISEYSLMVNYSLVECLILIPYDAIEGKYTVTGNLFYLSLLLFLYIYKTSIRKLISISILTSPYELQQTQNVNLKVYMYHKISNVIILQRRECFSGY